MDSPIPEQPASANAVTDAEKPFGASAKADIILRSSDRVDFFVSKAILAVASPFFDGMFSLEQKEGKGCFLNDTKNGLPIVELAEDSATLYNLLRLIYPYGRYDVKPNDADVYGKVANAIQKYAMDEVMERWKGLVASSEVMTKEPLRIFAIAVHFGWLDVMREAALNTLSIPFRDLFNDRCDDLGWITGADYHELFRWRFACQDAVETLLCGWLRNNSYSTMAFSLQERLRETGCPRGTVLMNDSIVTKAIESISGTKRPDYGRVLSNRTFMMNEIEKTVSTVPLKIDDMLIMPESKRLPLKINNVWVPAGTLEWW
jgi:hypothetical protein